MSIREQLQEFLRSRRSVRRFRPTGIERAVIDRVLETAASAPSAHNRQPWRFVVVSDVDHRSRLATSMAQAYARDLQADGLRAGEVEKLVSRSTDKIMQAPLLIVLCMDMSDMDLYSDPNRQEAERTMAVQSTSNAGLMMLLSAHAEGLGGVWSCAPLFAPAEISLALGLPDTWEPQATLMIGVPADMPKPRPRKGLSEVARFL